MQAVIIANSYEVYEKVCARHGLDQANRKEAIPLIMWTDRYRLWGRNIKGWKVIRVGEIEPAKLKCFKQELRKVGWGLED